LLWVRVSAFYVSDETLTQGFGSPFYYKGFSSTPDPWD